MINIPPPPGWKKSKKSKGVFRHTTTAEREIVANYIREHGCYKAEIEFCISSTMTRKIRKEFGIAPRPIGRSRQYTAEDVKTWIAYLAKNGGNVKQAARNFGCSSDTINRLINELETNNAVL